jgi:hypothetical protein
MSNVSSLPPRLSIVGGREAKGSAGINPIKSVMVSSYPVAEIEQYSRYERHQQPYPVGGQNELERRTVAPEGRRKASLRVIQQKMLVEFRSVRNRRRPYQGGSDIVEQIDEKA